MTTTSINEPAWFDQGEWKKGWTPNPDASIDKEEFIKQYSLQPERWQKAFKFLANNDLKTIPLGKYELEGTDLYVAISEYTTKNEEDAKCEAHHKYVDIQYVISGEEQISILPISDTQEPTPYNEEKDIYFIRPNYDKYYRATPDRFFIFFPNDAHRPCVKIRENAPVKKAVVKLRVN